jgi:hypothetical protein
VRRLVTVTDLVDRAAEIAEVALADALPRRWTHVQAVAAKASRISCILPAEDQEILVASAWLHDVGYAPDVADTGFHALDGARWLLRQQQPKRVAALVAYHSCALYEGEERGLADELVGEFANEGSPTTDALWYSDMTTGPDGQDFEVLARLAEVNDRYGPDHLVTRFWIRGRAPLLAAVGRVEKLLAAAHPI